MPVVTANVQEPQKVQTDNQNPVVPVVASASTNGLAIGGPTTFRARPTSPNSAANAVASSSTPSSAANVSDEQDPVDAVIPSGTRCKRLGCGVPFEPSSTRSESECTYHALPAIFHEGSKGYACCKRRVLEFDEFLRIEGCKKGRHCFVGAPKTASGQEEELVTCRSDMYQTPSQVKLSLCAGLWGHAAEVTRCPRLPGYRFCFWQRSR